MNTNNSDPQNDWLQIVQQHVESMTHGSVQIAVDDSKIVHLDTTRKFRLVNNPPSPQRRNLRPPNVIILRKNVDE
jgi:hypothetical protein